MRILVLSPLHHDFEDTVKSALRELSEALGIRFMPVDSSSRNAFELWEIS